MPRRPSDPELKAEFSQQIREILTKATAREVAEQLGVTVQTVYNYRKGKNAPSPEVIRLAMEKWPFKLTYRGRAFTLNAFGKKASKAPSSSVQYELWDAIRKLGPESVKIDILERRTSSVQLGVRIYFTRK